MKKTKKTNRKKVPVKQEARAPRKKLPVKKLLLLLLSFAVFYTVYQIAIYYYYGEIVHIYCISAGVLAVLYILYNRGRLTVPERDSLPDEWGEKEKDDFLAEVKTRRKKSSFLLYLLIPILLTVAFDMISIFLTLNMGIKLP